MGTSVSHRSPTTSNWNAVAAAYTSDAIPVDRAVKEIWRAATNQPTGDLANDLSKPIISQCLKIALISNTPQQAFRDSSRHIALSGQASLAADLAQRAVVKTSRTKMDRTEAFVQSLFGDAADYLVSRDIPGFVGIGDRLKTVMDSMTFKNQVRQRVVEVVNIIPRPPRLQDSPENWKKYVKTVVSALAGRE